MSGVKKGWCPTLERPMESGDGFLVRLNITSGQINTEEARAIAKLSSKYGNGHIDLTSRGNVQIRGVANENYAALYQELSTLGFTETPRTAHKSTPAQLPELGFIEHNTLALGLLFGRMSATSLAWLAEIAQEIITLSAVRTIYLHQIAANSADALLSKAESMGFIIHTQDPRRFIEACTGAPACSSAEGDTRNLALTIAQHFPHLQQKIHISGCTKGCAYGEKAAFMIRAHDQSYEIAYDAKASDAALYTKLSAQDVLTKLESA